MQLENDLLITKKMEKKLNVANIEKTYDAKGDVDDYYLCIENNEGRSFNLKTKSKIKYHCMDSTIRPIPRLMTRSRCS